jgi:hypothetical protein
MTVWGRVDPQGCATDWRTTRPDLMRGTGPHFPDMNS